MMLFKNHPIRFSTALVLLAALMALMELAVGSSHVLTGGAP